VATIDRKNIREEVAARVKGLYPKNAKATKWIEDNFVARLEKQEELTEEIVTREMHRAIIDFYKR
jgi:hypothetical protein